MNTLLAMNSGKIFRKKKREKYIWKDDHNLKTRVKTTDALVNEKVARKIK